MVFAKTRILLPQQLPTLPLQRENSHKMMQRTKAIFSWSGGKDSAMCLQQVLAEGKYEVVFLLTTLNATFRRVSMHGVREDLLDAQAHSIGLPLKKVWVTEGSNEEYEQKMGELLLQAKDAGVSTVIFGDIFLEDLRAYRESRLAQVGVQAVFPLWKQDTKALTERFMALGFKAVTCCVQDKVMGEARVGCELDAAFFDHLPQGVDPCGENGEYHSFCYDGPVFHHPVAHTAGIRTYRPIEGVAPDAVVPGFWYIDLLP